MEGISGTTGSRNEGGGRRTASSALSSNLVQRAIAEALNYGYQISPDAVKLFKRVAERRQSKPAGPDSQPPFEIIVKLVIENKVRSETVFRGSNAAQGVRSVGVQDLVDAFPEIFDFPEIPGTGVNPGTNASPTPTMNSQQPSSHSPIERDDEVEVLEDPTSKIEPVGMEGFAQLFKSRHSKIVRILMQRPEGRQITKISKLNNVKSGGNNTTKVAGLVFSRRQMKNGGVEFTLDDDTGSASILALSEDAKKAANEIVMDQCVLVDVEATEGRKIAKNIIQPDIPNKVTSTSKKTVYAVFLSDLHIGSNKFLGSAFNRFIDWLGGRWGNMEEDEEIIRRLKYVIIGGDVVDGVGVFPNQEYELSELDIYKQYEMVSEKLRMIPKHLQMFVIPGNHDATRQALPQPMIPKKYASSLYDFPNVKMLGDPCLFKLHGVSILVYHGRSLDDVLATTPGLSYERPQEAMKVLLRARHLAPIFGMRTPIAPEVEDHLVIGEAPDIFHAGHVHTVGLDRYKSTLIINSGTWQAQTGYQANLGISPRPGLVPIVNLATLDVEMREFLTSTPTSSRS